MTGPEQGPAMNGGGVKLAALVRDLPITIARGGPDPVVRAVAEDSRRIVPGALFVSRRGTVSDGRRHVGEAVRRGAAAVLSGPGPLPGTGGAAHLVCAAETDVPRCAAVLAERFFGEPSRHLALVGITGTNGKTTVATLVQRVLGAAGIRAGLIGTVAVDVGEGPAPAALTTPPALELSGLLAAAVANRCAVCALEVSSHALDQDRTAALRFDGAVFTNLSGDHLDYHRSVDAYRRAKAALFAAVPPAGWAVINAGDPAGAAMQAACRGAVLTTAVDRSGATCTAEIAGTSIDATRCTLRGPWGRITLRLPLVGRHNVANALQAAAVGHRLGLDAEALRAGLARCTAPAGRLEPVSEPGHPFTVLVDYAHTDAALEQALRGLRGVLPEGGKLRVVFGCGGDRDRTKRPRMAAAAWRHADAVIVTSDNPRTEDPRAIIEEVLRGVPAAKRAGTAVLPQRRAAIAAAIDSARGGDIVLIAGQGPETVQIVGRRRRRFDDRAVARTALRRRARRRGPGGREAS